MYATEIKPNTQTAQVLQALRANPLAPGQIAERWANGSTILAHLKSLGYIQLSGPRYSEHYRITEAGRAACPERRAAYPQGACPSGSRRCASELTP